MLAKCLSSLNFYNMVTLFFRIVEIVVAAILLLLLLPFFILAGVLVQIDSPGPVLFRQKRVGLLGKEFTLLKLRTMKKGANGEFPPHTQKNDKRFSPLCSLIRATCIDEVPQLWNVIVGDMHLIGPRPELPAIVQTYDNEQRKILNYKPGLLGISQLAFREGVDYRQKLKLENSYYPHRTWMKDFLISLLTPVSILSHIINRILNGKCTKAEFVDSPWFRILLGQNGSDPITKDDGKDSAEKETPSLSAKMLDRG